MTMRCVVCFEDKSHADFKATCASHAAEVCAACLAHPLMGRRCAVCRAELTGAVKRSHDEEEQDAARAVRRRVRHDAREAHRLFCEINREYFADLRARLRQRDGDDEGNDGGDDDDDTSSVSVDEDSEEPPANANANAPEGEFVPIRVRVDGRYLVFYHEV